MFGLNRQDVPLWHCIGPEQKPGFNVSAAAKNIGTVLNAESYRFTSDAVASRTLNHHTLTRSFSGIANVNGIETAVIFAPYSDEMRTNFTFAANDRHLTKHYDPLETVVDQIDLSGMSVLEVGFGTGYVSRIILKQDINHLLAYDIKEANQDEMMPGIIGNPKVELAVRDYRLDDLSFMEDGDWAVIANPPYKLIPDMKERIIDRYSPAGVILISSQWRTRDFEGYTVEKVQSGEDFSPPALGLHFIISNGFEGRWHRSAEEGAKERLSIKGKDIFPFCPSDEYGFDPMELRELYQFDW